MRKFLLAAAGALLLAAPAVAQTTTTTTTTEKRVTTPFSDDYVGRTVTTTGGQPVGTVTAYQDGHVHVRSGQHLGVGERIYVFPQDQIVVHGSGPQVQITTPLTREQIIVLPSP